MKLLRALAFALALLPTPALADFNFTQGAGSVAFDFTCFATKHCFATVVTNSAGTEIFTAAAPAQVTGANGTFPVTGTVAATQSGTWNIASITNALPTGGNTIGKVDILGNAGAILDFVGQNVASPPNALLMGAQFNTTPTTITTGNASPLQLDSAGNLLVNVKAGGGAGGTSSTFGAAFPATGTAIGLTSGANMIAWSATTTYGTAPAAIAVPAVNGFITGSTPEGALGAAAGCTSGASNTMVQCLYQLHSDLLGSTPAGSNRIGFVTPQADTTGGCTWAHYYMTGASTNSTLVSTGAHTLCGIEAIQISTGAGFLRLYDAAGAPTCGSGVGVVGAYPVQSNAVSPGMSIPMGFAGRAFANGLGFCFTNAVGDADNTNWAGTTNNVVLNIGYK